jgi:hypothetical protein
MTNKCFIPFSQWHHMKRIAGPSGFLFFLLENPSELHHSHIDPLHHYLRRLSCNTSNHTFGCQPQISCPLKWCSTSRCCMNGSNACCLHIGHSFIHLLLASFHLGNHAIPLFHSISHIARTAAEGAFASSLFCHLLLLCLPYYIHCLLSTCSTQPSVPQKGLAICCTCGNKELCQSSPFWASRNSHQGQPVSSGWWVRHKHQTRSSPS